MQQDSILFVGDIQGCAGAFTRLLKAAGYSPDRHRLIPVGDTINRGRENVEVLTMLEGLGCEPLQGNHEIKLIDAIRSPEKATWLPRQTVYEDLVPHKRCQHWVDWMDSWPVYREGPDWIAVHGGLHPLLPLHQTPADFLAFVRICTPDGRLPTKSQWDGQSDTIPPGFSPWHHFYQGEKQVIYGHWARQGLLSSKNTLCLDSGCVYGNVLTGYWFPEGRIVQVESGIGPRK